MKMAAWGRYAVFVLCGAVALFIFTAFSPPPAEAASCDGAATAPCSEDVTLDSCTQCHSMTIPGGNRNGTDRKITLSVSSNRHILSPTMADWTATVDSMIAKGSGANSAKTSAYLNTNYCPTCTGPILSSPAISGISSSGATVEWTTSANGFGDQPATSCVIYGTALASLTGNTCSAADPNYDPNSSNLVTTHSVPLTGLTPLTKYYVVHRSTAGSATTTYTLAASFTTPPSGGGGGGGGALGTIISLATGDYNNDLKIDLGVGVSTKNHVIAYLSNGSGGFTEGQTLANVGTTPTAAASGGVKGDFNEDGMDDLAVANFGDKNVAIFLGSIPSGFQTTAVSTVSVADPPTGVAIGDFNTDGVLDLAVATVKADGSQGAVLIFTGVNDGAGHGTGHFTGPVTTISVATANVTSPTITSITPNPISCPGLPTDITITGTLLLEGLTVTLDATLPLTVKSVSADSTTVVATVPASVAAGAHSVTVEVSGLPPASAPLTIDPSVVTVTSVSPTSRLYEVTAGGQVLVYGTDFRPGGTVSIGSIGGPTVEGTVAGSGTPFVRSSSTLARIYLSNTALAVGTYDVSYANNDSCGGVGVLTDGYTVAAPQPAITSLSENTVTYGVTASKSITIYGTNFVSGGTITVGSLSGTTVSGLTLATAADPFVFVSSTQLKFYWPNTDLSPGAYAVQVTNPSIAGGLSATLASAFTVIAPQPSVTSLSVSSVTYGVSNPLSVTIYGTNFVSGATITVGDLTGATVPGTTASAGTPFVYVSSSQLKFYWSQTSLPPGAYDVQVTNPAAAGGLSGTLAAAFTVAGAQPVVTSVSPTPETYGITGSTSITVYGDNFVLGATITVGSLSGPTVAGATATAAAPFVFVSKNQVKFYWANTSLAPGTYTVQVTNPAAAGGLSATLADAFTVTAPQPTITNLSPAQGTYGITSSTSITVFGSNFVLGASITIGSLSGTTVAGSVASAATPFVFVSASQVKFYWANTSLAPNVYSIQVTNPAAAGALSATLASAFTVVAPQPSVTSLSPVSVTYGVSASSSVTVYGSNFILGATITVGSLTGPTVAGSVASAATPFVYVSNSQLKFYWPNTSLSPGSYAVSVVNTAAAGGLASSLADGFVVAAPQPAVSSASPTSVTYGVTSSQSVTISGSNFVLGATITVGSLSGPTVSGSIASAATPFVYVSNSQLKFYWPNSSLPVGSYTVTVTNPAASGGLSANLAGGFVVLAAQPTISSVSPTPVTRGVTSSRSISVNGSSFVLGATITVGTLSGTTVAGTTATAATPFVYVSSGRVAFYWNNLSLPVGSYSVDVVNPPVSGGLATSLANGFVVQ